MDGEGTLNFYNQADKLKFMALYRLSFILLFVSNVVFAQGQKSLNLWDLHNRGLLQIVNRESKAIQEEGKNIIRLSEGKGEGLVWLPTKGLKNGIVEIEMRGKDVLQRSFIGIIFHGLNDSTYDAVYCRPFNFFAKDSVRKIHAIQYISHPTYTWRKLREERSGIFEKEIESPPNPNGWFTMKLVINNKTIEAFINQSQKPSLVVEKLTERMDGKLGIFIGDGSGGDFYRITITNMM